MSAVRNLLGLRTAAVAVALVLLPACWMKPWEEAHVTDDDSQDDDDTQGDDDDSQGDDDDTQGDDDDTQGDDDDTSELTDWVDIPGGTYEMGEYEFLPFHDVDIPAFKMWRTEVTVDQYRACFQDGFCSTPDANPSCSWWETWSANHPINCVTWQQATDFCEWVEGRLPSESEWEYAGRSLGVEVSYPWGADEASCTYAVMNDTDYSPQSGCGTAWTWEVCSISAGHTAQELCDMTGNVWEWVQDWYHDCYDCALCPNEQGCDDNTVAPVDGSAWEDPTGTHRVVRGGGYESSDHNLRATWREQVDPAEYRFHLGFRCAK